MAIMARTAPSSETPRSRSIPWIVGSTVVLVLVSILGGLALMLFAARQLDHIESNDERELAQRTVQRDLKRMTRELTSATVWDEAYKAMGPTVDAAWADTNFADYYNQYFGHDLTFAVRDGTITYASLAGARVNASRIETIAADAKVLIDAVTTKATAAHAAGKLNLDGVSTGSGLIESGDEIYFVVVADVIAETATMAASKPPPPTVIVSARRLSASVIRGMQEDLGIPGLTLARHAQPGAPGVPLLDPAGKTLGVLSWTPMNPGMSLLLKAAPWLVLGFVLLTGAGVVLLLRVAESLQKLDQNRLALIAAKEQAEAANIAKTQFLANMSHEIRTPLNGVLGMAQIMEADQLSVPQRERLGIINESGRALLALLNGVLDMARLESGAVKLRHDPFDLITLVDSTCAAFSGAAASKAIALHHTVSPECRGVWIGDPMRLRQVMGNLIANAVKFTDTGSVRVTVGETPTGIRFEVSDTGMGVAREDQARLFEKFSQVDPSMTRSHDGSGLGLAICQELVDLMGGEIGVDSQAGAGSTFHFEVPLEHARTERQAPRAVKPS